jgi:hypothetical protein
VISATVGPGGAIRLLGTVRGLAADVAPVRAELDRLAPGAIGLGISFDELTGLRDHFVGRPSEPLVPLTASETAEVRGLARFGEIRVPNPTCLAALEWGRAHAIEVEALDPSDDAYATLFTDHISYLELVRRTLAERRLTRRPPAAASPEQYAEDWHRSLARGKGSRRFDAARDAALVGAARTLGARARPLAVLVDRERFAGIRAMLDGAAPLRR